MLSLADPFCSIITNNIAKNIVGSPGEEGVGGVRGVSGGGWIVRGVDSHRGWGVLKSGGGVREGVSGGGGG